VPQRIVTLEYSFVDHLGVLGFTPVGYAVDAPPEYILEFTEEAGAQSVGTRAAPSLETIASLDPDLIIADLYRHETIYEQLSAIAPTVVYNSLRGSYQDQLDSFDDIAKIMNKEREADALIAGYDEAFAEAMNVTDPDAGNFVIGVLWPGGFTAHSDQSFMGSFVESLGRENALEPRQDETQFLIDMEGFASINPDTIAIMCSSADQTVLDEWQSSPLWQAFEAVKNDHVYVFDRNLWSKGRGLMAYHAILEDAVESGLLTESPSTYHVCH
jgi:iron complex transport system substrate-binding protein